MTVYIIRHGETEWNAIGRWQGRSDVELSEKGIWQAERLGAWFRGKPVDAVFSSDLRRAYKTASYVAGQKGLEIFTDERLREINVGEWEGKKLPDIREEYKGFVEEWEKDGVNIAIPGGESYSQVFERITEAYRDIIARAYENLVLVSHGGAIRALLCGITGLSLDKRLMFEVYNTAVTIIEYGQGCQMPKIIGLNSTEHLYSGLEPV